MNDHVHPIFKDLLQPPHGPHEPLVYDEHDEDLFHDVVANSRLQKPIQELLITLANLEAIQASFGEPDKARAFDRLLPELKALKEGFIDAMRDL